MYLWNRACHLGGGRITPAIALESELEAVLWELNRLSTKLDEWYQFLTDLRLELKQEEE
jgi:hypothetical protein